MSMRVVGIRARPRRANSPKPPSKAAPIAITKGGPRAALFRRLRGFCTSHSVPFSADALCLSGRRVYQAAVTRRGIAMLVVISRIRCSALAFAVLAALFGASAVEAQTKVVPESRAQVQLSVAPIVKLAAPAVVNVYAARVEKRPQNRNMDDFFRRFFGEEGPSVPQGRSQTSVGSGVIVDPSGLVVTNNHVIENMTEVKVALSD